MLLGILAYILLSLAMWSCMFMEINGYLYADDPYTREDASPHLTSRIGPFSYQDFGEFGSTTSQSSCISYSSGQVDNFLDGPFKAARAFAVIGNICIGAGTLALTLLSCAFVESFLLKVFGGFFIIGSIFEALIFVIYASKISDEPHNAKFWWGSGLNVFGTLFALLAGFLTLKLPECDCEDAKSSSMPGPARPVVSEQAKSKAPRPGTEMTTEQILPNGQRKYTTTRWGKNGEKTVEETIADE